MHLSMQRASRSNESTRNRFGRIGFAIGLAALLHLVAASLLASTAAAVSFRVDFRSSTYTVQSGDSFSDLLAQHSSESLIQSTITSGIEDISTTVYAGGVTNDYSVLMEATLEVAVAGQYRFQVGTDWGRGGAAALIDNSDGSVLDERVILGDVWWNYDWNDPDVFTTAFDLAAGDSVTLQWVGFEGCCGGASTIRFEVDGSGFVPLTEPNLTPFAVVPEPTSGLLLLLGLTGLGHGVRRR